MSAWSLKHEGRRPVVLLAEDDLELRRLFSQALAEHYDLVECDDGVALLEAIGAARQGRVPYPDLIVTDERLPGLTGLDALAELREHDPFLPALVVTGHADSRLRARAACLGTMSVLEKPVDPEALAEWVRLLVECFQEDRDCLRVARERPARRRLDPYASEEER